MKRAIYPGTFDPITNGHLDVIKKASRIFDETILAVADFTGKDTTFNLEERIELCREAAEGINGVVIKKCLMKLTTSNSLLMFQI